MLLSAGRSPMMSIQGRDELAPHQAHPLTAVHLQLRDSVNGHPFHSSVSELVVGSPDEYLPQWTRVSSWRSSPSLV